MTELTAKYRTVFGSAYGQDVLADILTMTHFGNTLDPDNKAQIAEHNVGVVILGKLGVFSRETKGEVMKALLTVSPKETEERQYGELKPEREKE